MLIYKKKKFFISWQANKVRYLITFWINDHLDSCLSNQIPIIVIRNLPSFVCSMSAQLKYMGGSQTTDHELSLSQRRFRMSKDGLEWPKKCCFIWIIQILAIHNDRSITSHLPWSAIKRNGHEFVSLYLQFDEARCQTRGIPREPQDTFRATLHSIPIYNGSLRWGLIGK